MALETLQGVTEVNGEKIIVMDDLKTQYPEKFSKETSQMDYAWFEKDIRPFNFIYVRNDVNSLSFTLQNGAIKEVGKNGCQVVDIIAVAKIIIEGLNAKYPCVENQQTIAHLQDALDAQTARTKNREDRNVEGTSVQ